MVAKFFTIPQARQRAKKKKIKVARSAPARATSRQVRPIRRRIPQRSSRRRSRSGPQIRGSLVGASTQVRRIRRRVRRLAFRRRSRSDPHIRGTLHRETKYLSKQFVSLQKDWDTFKHPVAHHTRKLNNELSQLVRMHNDFQNTKFTAEKARDVLTVRDPLMQDLIDSYKNCFGSKSAIEVDEFDSARDAGTTHTMFMETENVSLEYQCPNTGMLRLSDIAEENSRTFFQIEEWSSEDERSRTPSQSEKWSRTLSQVEGGSRIPSQVEEWFLPPVGEPSRTPSEVEEWSNPCQFEEWFLPQVEERSRVPSLYQVEETASQTELSTNHILFPGWF